MEFEKFWEMWPKKVAKKKAESAWSKLTQLEKREAMEALPNHLKYWEVKQTHIDFIPYPASWIRYKVYVGLFDFPVFKVVWQVVQNLTIYPNQIVNTQSWAIGTPNYTVPLSPPSPPSPRVLQ